MLKKSLALLLTIAMTASLIAGCSKTEKEAETTAGTQSAQTSSTSQEPAGPDYGDTGGLKLPITDKPVTLSAIVSAEVADISSKLVAQELEKRTGVKLDIQAYPMAVAGEKIKARVTSGDIPDLLSGFIVTDYNKLGLDGALAPINKYAKELPNFSKVFLEENAWVMKSYTADDNNLYFWPSYNTNRDVNHGFMYRKDIFDKNSLKEWNNTEEFYQTLKKLKEIYPDSFPWANKYKDELFYNISYGWGLGSYAYPCYYDENAKQWKMAVTDTKWKELLDFMKKLYSEGLLDQEFLTCTPADFQAKMTDGRSFVFFDWIGRMSLFTNLVKDKIPEYDIRYANPIGPEGKIRELQKVNPSGIAIKNNDKKVVAMKFLDYLTSPSGSELYTVGIKDVTYKKDAGGKVTWPEFPADKQLSFNDMTEKYGMFVQGIYTRVHPDSVYFNYTPNEKEAQEKMLNGNRIEKGDPVLKFNSEETEIVNELAVQLQKKAQEFSSRYVIEKSYGDKQWNDWVSEAQKLGLQKLVDCYNAAQKRYDEQK